MQFCPEDGGEPILAKAGGVGDGVVLGADEVIGQRDKIIALGLIAAANFMRFKTAIGQGGMGMQVAAPELAGLGKGG
jgi:hypothetical protein